MHNARVVELVSGWTWACSCGEIGRDCNTQPSAARSANRHTVKSGRDKQ